MAIGADRAILVETAGRTAAAGRGQSLLKAIVDKEQPGLVILGKQAIDDDCNQTGQMLAALATAPGHLRQQGRIADDKARVTREVDGGLETIPERCRPSSPPTCA